MIYGSSSSSSEKGKTLTAAAASDIKGEKKAFPSSPSESAFIVFKPGFASAQLPDIIHFSFYVGDNESCSSVDENYT